MSTRRTTLTLTYVFIQTLLGFWAHPFKTVRHLVEDKTFLPLIFFPALALLLLFLLWKFIIWPLALYLAPLLSNLLPTAFISFSLLFLDFLKWWVFYFCLFWQALLLALTIKFTIFLKNFNQ